VSISRQAAQSVAWSIVELPNMVLHAKLNRQADLFSIFRQFARAHSISELRNQIGNSIA
jgi:hypothetical protein